LCGLIRRRRGQSLRNSRANRPAATIIKAYRPAQLPGGILRNRFSTLKAQQRMSTRLFAVLVLSLTLVAPASAQVVRFSTNVGSFDMTLNPTNDPNLQPLVDNLVAYIGLGRYHFSAINRAADGQPGTQDDFVLQMGGFMGFPIVPDLWAELHTSVETLQPVIVDATGAPDGGSDGVVDFTALSNTRGRVSLALQSGNPNSGTSSFFVNLRDNSTLDAQGFVPFAEIDDMATIDRIMQLTQTDLSQEVGQPGSLAYVDVPLTESGSIVVVKNVEVIEADVNFSFVGPIAAALKAQEDAAASQGAALAAATSLDATIAAEAVLEDVTSDEMPLEQPVLPGDAIEQSAVPEPSTMILGAAGLVGVLFAAGRRLAL
jgi:peptidyl-prolyl cis-trans isomerase A (cyclophilin A)